MPNRKPKKTTYRCSHCGQTFSRWPYQAWIKEFCPNLQAQTRMMRVVKWKTQG